MRHRRLGDRGPLVSRLALGTMTFGLRCDETTSRRIFDTALDAGITFIDTADVYPYAGDLTTVGTTERLLGPWLRGRRDDVVLATKVGGQMGPRPSDAGNSARHVREAVHACLDRLETDVIDLLQLHGFDTEVPVDETADALVRLVDEGKVRHLGVSNFPAPQVRAMDEACAARGIRLTAQQPRYSLLVRGIEREILPVASDLGIGTLVYNPLAGGMLSGVHRRGDEPAGRFAFGNAAAVYRERYWNEGVFDAVEQLAAVARDAGLTLPILATAWVLAHDDIDSVILGASSPEHVQSSLQALDVELSQEIMDRLDEITRPFRMTEGVNAGLPRR